MEYKAAWCLSQRDTLRLMVAQTSLDPKRE